VIGVATLIAVSEPRPGFSQVVRRNRLMAPCAQGSPAGRPPIHKYKFHVASPEAKQNTVMLAKAVVRRRLETDVTICGRTPYGP
jgi:hypothetical protein